MNDLIIGIDAGKWSTVAESKLGSCYFKTRVDETTDDVLGDTKKSFKVEFENKSFIVGDEAIQSDYDTTKATFHHKLAIYTAVSLILKGSYKNVYLVIGCPASIYKNAKLREDYRKYLLQNQAISIKINGEKNQFFIKDIIIAPETLGCPYTDLVSSSKKLQGVIDIGGLNTNGCVYNGLTPIKDTMFTINLGSYILFNKIKNELSTQLNQNIQDYEIPFLINECKSIQARKIIDSILDSHIRVIKDEMKKNNWNVNGLELRFIGGGSKDLEHQIYSEFSNAVVQENSIKANALAFLKVGEIYYGKN